jgi:uncharacterized protein (TIGR02996 family)
VSEDVYRVRFVEGALQASVPLVRECTGLDLRTATELVETQGVVLDQLSLSEARRVAERFNAACVRVEIEPSVATADDFAQLESSAREPVLEAALRERPDDVAAHLVYGDWLQARGDPRGELVALQVELARAEGPAKLALEQQDREFRRRHAQHLFGPLHAVADELVRRWSLGFADAVSLGLREHDGGTVPMRLLAQVLGLPIAARMTSLSLAIPALRRRDVDRVLCRSEVVGCLRTLELRNYSFPLPGEQKSPSLASLWPHLRKLETLIVYGYRPPLRELSVPTLSHLVLRMSDAHYSLGQHLPQSPIAVSRLTFEFTSRWPITSDMWNMLSWGAPRVRADVLALACGDVTMPFDYVRRLPDFMSLCKAKRLDLSRCVVDPVALRRLVEMRDRGELSVEGWPRTVGDQSVTTGGTGRPT